MELFFGCLLFVVVFSITTFSQQPPSSVVALSKIFETRLGQSFPFPRILWVVQQFEHDLLSLSMEEYLDFAVREKANPYGSDEIRKYNETVRVMQQFPHSEAPRIVLFPHPHHASSMKKLPTYDFVDLDHEYQDEIGHVRNLILSRVFTKKFNMVSASGECKCGCESGCESGGVSECKCVCV